MPPTWRRIGRPAAASRARPGLAPEVRKVGNPVGGGARFGGRRERRGGRSAGGGGVRSVVRRARSRWQRGGGRGSRRRPRSRGRGRGGRGRGGGGGGLDGHRPHASGVRVDPEHRLVDRFEVGAGQRLQVAEGVVVPAARPARRRRTSSSRCRRGSARSASSPQRSRGPAWQAACVYSGLEPEPRAHRRQRGVGARRGRVPGRPDEPVLRAGCGEPDGVVDSRRPRLRRSARGRAGSEGRPRRPR